MHVCVSIYILNILLCVSAHILTLLYENKHSSRIDIMAITWNKEICGGS